MKTPTVVIAMSGGVDSSVAAALLVEQGYSVIGMMLRLWTEDGQQAYNRCCTPEAMGLARKMAAHLDIPFYAVDVRERFRNTVVQYFIDSYLAGDTPNPCLVCNREIRWGHLLNHAKGLGADFMATGHYARVQPSADHGVQLLRAVDKKKDQSYVLSVLSQSQLKHAMFPIGAYTKTQVRELAAQYQLPAADRADSQDLCFITEGDYRTFLTRNSTEMIHPGEIITGSGEVLGTHQGLPFYTVGQRRGIGIASDRPYYVMEKNSERNQLIIGHREEMGKQSLHAEKVNWVSGTSPANPFKASVKIRYQAREAQAVVTPLSDEKVSLKFKQPLMDITPGQMAVIYDGEICLGGGIIRSAT